MESLQLLRGLPFRQAGSIEGKLMVKIFPDQISLPDAPPAVNDEKLRTRRQQTVFQYILFFFPADQIQRHTPKKKPKAAQVAAIADNYL